MTTIVLQDLEPVADVRERDRVVVGIRERWDDDWTWVDDLEPVAATYAVAPGVGQARLRYRYGEILPELQTSYSTVAPLTLLGWYVRIAYRSLRSALWTGVITDDQREMLGRPAGDPPAGDQQVIAVGLEHLLDRVTIGSAVGYTGPDTVATIGYAPPFNALRRGTGLVGNRSLTDDYGTYIYGTDGTWTRRQAVEYLLATHAPDITWRIGGQYDALDTVLEPINTDGVSVRDAINRIIDRRRGLTWHVRCDEDTASIHVGTTLAEPLAVGTVTVPACRRRTTLDLDRDELRGPVTLRESAAATYDSVTVEGERIRSCWTASYLDGTLEPAWTEAEEDAYAAGDTSASANATSHDTARARDALRRVYQAHRIPAGWDWTTTNHRNLPTAYNARPAATNDGSVATGEEGAIWPGDRALLPHLPIEAGGGDTFSTTEYLRALAIIYHDGVYYQLDEVPPESDLEPAQVRVMDGEMGLWVEPRMNHLLGSNHLSPGEEGAGESNVTPLYDYEDLLATVAVELDERVRVSVPIRQGDRELRVRVPGAHLWYVVPGTVTGTTDSVLATSQLAQHDGGLIRDDSAVLADIAAAMRAWYGQTRRALEATYDGIGWYAEPGQLIEAVGRGLTVTDVNTVATSVEWDFAAQTTRVATDYSELDVPGLALAGTSPRELARRLDTAEARLLDLEERTRDLPGRSGTLPF